MQQALNTILAALRLLERTGIPADLIDIASNGGETDLMTAREIDILCERLNCGFGLFCYVRVYVRSPGHPKGSPQPAFTHTFVQAANEEDAYTLGGTDPFDAALMADGYAPANDYVIACGPLLQPAHCEPDAAIITVSGGVADIMDGSRGNIRIMDFDNIKDEDGEPCELPRGEGFEEIIEANPDLEEGKDFIWEKP